MPNTIDNQPELEDFICECGSDWKRLACQGLELYKEQDGKLYCVLHYPSKEKARDFELVIKKKRANKDFNFQGVWFPEPVDFSGFKFNKLADFNEAIFSEAAIFNGAEFLSQAHFTDVVFEGQAVFSSVRFKEEANFIKTNFCASSLFDNSVFSASAYFEDSQFKKNANFGGTEFNAETYFGDVVFCDVADFHSVKLNAGVNFSSATFAAGASFTSSTFGGEAIFGNVTFNSDVDFRSTSFGAFAQFSSTKFKSKAYFISATFGAQTVFSDSTLEADIFFNQAIFNELLDLRRLKFTNRISFNSATFKDYVKFSLGADYREPQEGLGKPVLDFRLAIINQLDRVSFHSMALRPNWFIDIDPRKFEFTNVEWKWPDGSIERSHKGIDQEIKELTQKQDSSPYRLLSIACRNLATNAEENNRYTEAGHFRYWAMDLRRREKWQGWAFWTLDWWYWLASGYGERIGRAFCALLGVWLLFVLLYKIPYARFEAKIPVQATTQNVIDEPLSWSRTFTYSLGVMTLQKPSPLPSNNLAYTLVYLETAFGPLQAALLALAVRRRFMR